MPFEPSARFEDYEIVQPLGSGGMGAVWLATEVRLGRKVALKLLPIEVTRDPARILRFEQEARAASALNHPNVCTIHALGETADGIRYIAMEYVEGDTLRQRLATTRFSTRAALDITIQMAAALSAAHAAGIIHRDIKPENVMLRPDGLVKVLDFGLAKLALSPDASADTTTRLSPKTDAGLVVGTVAYMSPEQARGQEVDARTDIWSLWVLLYEIVAGRSPFAASSGTEVLAAILDRDPAPLTRFEPDTPAELQRIVTKSLRKERSMRYQTVQDLLLDLQALRDDLQAQARSGSSPSMTATDHVSSGAGTVFALTAGLHHRRRLVLAISIVLAGLLAATAWGVIYSRSSVPPSTVSSVPVERNLRRLTFESGLQTDVTFSPDGRFIAYASDRAGNFDIWVQPVSGGDAVPITRSPAQDTEPDWSPDGSTLVFRSEREGGGLFIVPALGGPEQRLTSFGRHPHWSAAGLEILFIASNVSPDEAGYPGTGVKIYVTSIGTERPTELLSDFVEKGSWYWVAGHPDGRVSLYGRSRRDHAAGFFTVSRDGRNAVVSQYATQVPTLLRAEAGQIRRFHWNASGTALYVEALSGGVRNLWRVDVDKDTLRWRSADRLTTSGSNEGAIALSRDGTHLAFTNRVGATRLWTFALDATGARIVDPGKPITDDGAGVEDFDLSRDGRLARSRWHARDTRVSTCGRPKSKRESEN
jgi:serine/threonine protein kinase